MQPTSESAGILLMVNFYDVRRSLKLAANKENKVEQQKSIVDTSAS